MRLTLLTISILLMILTAGCATYTGVGSQTWYEKRLVELDNAYNSKQITQAEYQTLKNQVEAMRMDYLDRNSYDYRPRLHFGYGYHLYR